MYGHKKAWRKTWIQAVPHFTSSLQVLTVKTHFETMKFLISKYLVIMNNPYLVAPYSLSAFIMVAYVKKILSCLPKLCTFLISSFWSVIYLRFSFPFVLGQVAGPPCFHRPNYPSSGAGSKQFFKVFLVFQWFVCIGV